MSNYSGMRLFEMMDDGQVNTLSQAADRSIRERSCIGSDDGLDQILSQSLDMFEEQKKLADY